MSKGYLPLTQNLSKAVSGTGWAIPSHLWEASPLTWFDKLTMNGPGEAMSGNQPPAHPKLVEGHEPESRAAADVRHGIGLEPRHASEIAHANGGILTRARRSAPGSNP